jgi:hypothetical protein
MHAGYSDSQVRGEVSSSYWPSQLDRLSSANVSLANIPYLASFALRASNNSLEEYWDAVVPALAFVVEAFLGLVSVFVVALLYHSFTRPKQPKLDPGAMAAVMSLVADNRSLLSNFGP